MRVYEIAKQKGVSSKEILGLLKKAGIGLSSHMSVVSKKGISHIEKVFAKSQKESVKKKFLVKKTISNEKKPIKAEVEVKDKKKEIVPVKQKVETFKPKVAPKIKKPTKRFVKKVVKRPARLFPQARKVITEITVEKASPLFRAAELMGKSSGELILALLKKGMVCNRNHILPVETILMLANLFDIKAILKTEKKALAEEEVSKKVVKGVARWPIVVVMGHVDHGKTTLLDFIRKMNTASREKGGITQHLGAYEADSKHGKIVFLDTPGHEAFSYLRSRGVRVTDIVVLVVAADDGIMPQTVEAIEHARNSRVPIIVAINKIDKVGSSAIQTVKRQLAEKNLVVEDWGGDIICVPISAKTGQGVDELLEMIVLQSQMMDLKANPKTEAKAFVLESKLEKGFGPVATIICLDGTIHQGDHFICGSGAGKVRLLINSFGEKLSQAGPSVPLKVVGFDNFAEIGDWLKVVPIEQYHKARSAKKVSVVSPIQAPRSLGLINKERINLIIKTDTRGSKEAIEGSVEKLSKKYKDRGQDISIVHSDVGDISESDVEFAYTTNSRILALHVKTERNAEFLARERSVEIKSFGVIYHLIEFLEEILSRKKIEKVWKKVGLLEVLKVFRIKKVGVVAGCGVKEGVISRDNKVICVRDGKELGGGKISSLQREGKTVKEVHAGYECGFVCEAFNDWQVGDQVEVLTQVEETS